MKWIFIQVLTLAALAGCATDKFEIENQQLPISEIQQAIVASLPNGQRKAVQGGREFYSNFFVPKSGQYSSQKDSVRFYAYVVILGDRRPYDIQITVYRQELKGREYHDVGVDKGLGRMVMRKLQSALSKRRGERDFIDDFRVF